ncbi:hypothetical protein PCANC_00684 [Puccinia coronata f. sp. avenae]|uniref:Carbohydrate esterase family 16 protein n=1 Tax=Puccinia coronata f. sp. avenae TaxID=200324 RepID=A0A2N5VNI9_9BASI|nr:hypothetical protein PCASD_00421 [Puccinia coronata f. sp. avenae]PLW58046.1 hypothetical protein PCANC_00684 [Puccinia coronata f. sp. avenae]
MRGLGFFYFLVMCCSVVLPKAITYRTSESMQFSSIVVFGASYCDNAHSRDEKFSSSLRPPPYYHGRWSNGPVWVEHIAEVAGVPLYNYAYGGATSNNEHFNGGVPDTRSQIQDYRNDIESGRIHRGDGKVLHLMWVGINAIHQIWHSGEGVEQAVEEAEEVKRQFNYLLNDPIINRLPSEFHALTLPPLEIVPNDAYVAWGQGGIKMLTDAYNNHLISAIQSLNSPAALVHDIGSFWYRVHRAPNKFGFSNVKSACLSGAQPCKNPGQFIYFDSLHPTTKMHALIGDWVMSTLPAVGFKHK